MITISNDTNALQGTRFACSGGMFLIRLRDDSALPGKRSGDVLDDNGTIIGDASDYAYCGRGFAVHTAPYAGFVSIDQIRFV